MHEKLNFKSIFIKEELFFIDKESIYIVIIAIIFTLSCIKMTLFYVSNCIVLNSESLIRHIKYLPDPNKSNHSQRKFSKSTRYLIRKTLKKRHVEQQRNPEQSFVRTKATPIVSILSHPISRKIVQRCFHVCTRIERGMSTLLPLGGSIRQDGGGEGMVVVVVRPERS